MERANILLIAVIVAGLSFFALRFFADSDTPSASRNGGKHSSRGVDVTADGHGDEERSEGFAAGEAGPRGALAGSRSGRTQPRRGEWGDGRGPSHSGRGSAQVLAGGDRSRSGSVGTSASGRRGTGGPGGVSIVDSLREGAAGGKSDLQPGGSSNLVETLAAQPSTKGTLLDGDPENVEGEDDIVLSVTSPEDTHGASQSADLHDAKFGEGVELTPDSVLAFPDAGNVKGDSGTISVDFTSNWAGSDESNNTLVQIRVPNGWDNRFELVKNGKYLRFIIADSTGNERDISYNIDSWVVGERHQVTPTWGDGTMGLYIDGHLVGQNTYSGLLEIPPGTPMQVGSEYGNYKGLDGTVHKMVAWGRARTADEIAGGY